MILKNIKIMIRKISLSLSALPFIIASGAVILFILGYVAHSLLGDNNDVEETAEYLLKKEYNVDVEFSGKKENVPV